MRLAVGIATVGRPRLLGAVVDQLTRQARRPDRIVVCAPTSDDVMGIEASSLIEIVVGPRGLTRQRNAILERVEDYDVLQFFDDDFIPAAT